MTDRPEQAVERVKALAEWHAAIAERGAATVERYALRAGRGMFTASNAAGVEEVSDLVDQHGQATADLNALLSYIAELEAANGRLATLGRAVERERDEVLAALEAARQERQAAEARLRALLDALEPLYADDPILADCVDNVGRPYTSAWLGEQLAAISAAYTAAKLTESENG